MGMQTDVKSAHVTSSGVTVDYRTRLKGAVVSANAAAATRHAVFANNVTQAGTYGRSTTTVTCTITNHGLVTGDRVWLVFAAGTGGTATTGVYSVTVTNANVFTVTDAASGTITGTPVVTMYADILMEIDSYNPTAFNVLVPGEGIVATSGIYTGLATNVTATVFYG
jgi:hypothetical protein